MKQAQSGTSRSSLAGRWWSLGAGAPRPMAMGRTRPSAVPTHRDPAVAWSWTWSLGHAVLALIAAAWFIATLPFRLAFWVIALLGRVTGIVIGFALMVTGMFFLAGPLFLIGVPLFLIGIVLTLRCLE